MLENQIALFFHALFSKIIKGGSAFLKYVKKCTSSRKLISVVLLLQKKSNIGSDIWFMNNEIMLNAVVLYFTYGKRIAALNEVKIRHSLLEYAT